MASLHPPTPAQRRAWLQQCSPIFMQPIHDIKYGHSLAKVFYEFREEGVEEIVCDLVMVYEGEASYRRLKPKKKNHFATFFYMTFNKYQFGRTADIDYLTLTGVDFSLEEGKPPWRSIRTRDHCGTQTWSQGNKGNLSIWLSLFYHYNVDSPYSAWQKASDSHHPIIFVNTANHLIGETNSNPLLESRDWLDYAIERGGAKEAEVFARTEVTSKPTLWNPFPRKKGRSTVKKGEVESALNRVEEEESKSIRVPASPMVQKRGSPLDIGIKLSEGFIKAGPRHARPCNLLR